MVGPVNNPIEPLPITPLSDTEIAEIGSFLPADSLSPFDFSITDYHLIVSDSVVGQQAADIIGLLVLAENRRAIFLAAIQRAREIATMINLASQYRSIQRQISTEYANLTLIQANLATAAPSVTATLGSYLSDLQNAETSLNTAQGNYNAFIPSYTSQVAAYQAAVSAYDSALNIYNQALVTYNNSAKTTADQQALNSASLDFQLAQNVYSSAKSNMDTYETQLAALQFTLNTASGLYNNAATNYNNFASQMGSNVIINAYNSGINDYNTSINKINGWIAQLNAMADTLRLNTIDPLPTAPLVSLSYTATSTTSNPNKANASNSVASLGSYIDSTVLPDYNAAYLNATTALLSGAPVFLPVPVFKPTTPIGDQAYPLIPSFNPVSVPVLALPPDIYQDPSANTPPLGSLGDFANQLTEIDDQNYTTNNSPSANINKRTTPDDAAGGAGASTQLSTIDPKAQGANPFSESDLSKQSIEALFAVFGVPVNSPLVDQLSALIQTLTEASGITSTPIAQDLLSTNSVNTNHQYSGVAFILGLANLSGLSSLIEDGTLRASIEQILQQDPNFNALSADQQSALLDALTQELGAALLITSLANLAQQFGMPGLIPQLLVAAAGLGTDDGLGSLQSQLFYSSVFSQQLQTSLNISSDLADQIASQAVTAAAATPQGITPDTLTEAAVRLLNEQGITTVPFNGSITNDQIQSSSLDDLVNAAAVASKQIVDDQVASQDQAQRQAYADSLTSALLGKGILDQTQAARLNQELANATNDQLDEIAINALKEFNLSQEEINSLLKAANQAADIQNSNLNPIAGLVSNAPFSNAQSGFESIAREILIPEVGEARATQIASDYGRLIFSSPNSFLVMLQDNERSYADLTTQNQSDRLFDEYFSYTADIRNPMISPSNPLQLGETLLLTANMGGPSTAGITSVDNQLGVFGNARYNPTGILG